MDNRIIKVCCSVCGEPLKVSVEGGSHSDAAALLYVDACPSCHSTKTHAVYEGERAPIELHFMQVAETLFPEGATLYALTDSGGPNGPESYPVFMVVTSRKDFRINDQGVWRTSDACHRVAEIPPQTLTNRLDESYKQYRKIVRFFNTHGNPPEHYRAALLMGALTNYTELYDPLEGQDQ